MLLLAAADEDEDDDCFTVLPAARRCWLRCYAMLCWLAGCYAAQCSLVMFFFFSANQLTNPLPFIIANPLTFT